MNILIPHTWLLEHLETDATPTEIQKYVSLCGPSIERIYEREGEPVYDIEVTTNRVDSMSVRGIAREAAVILPQFGVAAKLKPLSLPAITPAQSVDNLKLPQIIDDQKLCKRTICVALGNVQRAKTPALMAKRLQQIDINVHDAVIDITNYITHELGHPCHAFDYDRIMELGGTVIITTAEAGKEFTTLDNQTYTTIGDEVVFENQQGEIIDLPGIKGTANTSINDSTKNVLLWIENIDAERIRHASMSHGIRTVAAQLNEKHVDPGLAEDVLKYGVQLYQKMCKAQVVSKVDDRFPRPNKLQPIAVPVRRITDYLGIDIPVQQIATILETLECKVELKAAQSKRAKGEISEPTFIVSPPSFRPDLELPADVIEEVARIYGYHKLPSKIMDTAIPLNKPSNTDFAQEYRVKQFLADLGWQELYTYSMVSEKIALQSGWPLDEHLKIANPLTDDRVYLRRSLLPSLNEVLTANHNVESLSVFEIAYVYHPAEGKLPTQNLHLALLSRKSFRHAKGDLEALCRQFFIDDLIVEPTVKNAQLAERGKLFGLNWRGKQELLGEIGVTGDGYFVADLQLSALQQISQSHPQYQAQIKTNQIIEDLTFTFSEKIAVGTILGQLKNIHQHLYSIELVGEPYRQNYSFRVVYANPNEHLSIDQVAPIRTSIISRLATEYNAKLVGQVV